MLTTTRTVPISVVLLLLLMGVSHAQVCPILDCAYPISQVSAETLQVITQSQTVIDLINSYKPVLANFSETTCFEHPNFGSKGRKANVVAGTIKTYGCPKGSVCNLQRGQFAWFNNSYQANQTLGLSNTSQSIYNGKIQEKSCEDVSNLQQQLLNGRTCQFSTQCVSRVCADYGKCVGLA